MNVITCTFVVSAIIFIVLGYFAKKNVKPIEKSFDITHSAVILSIIVIAVSGSILIILLSFIAESKLSSSEFISHILGKDSPLKISSTFFLILFGIFTTIHRFRILDIQNSRLISRNEQLNSEQKARDNRQVKLDEISIFYSMNNHFCEVLGEVDGLEINANDLFDTIFKNPQENSFSPSSGLTNTVSAYINGIKDIISADNKLTPQNNPIERINNLLKGIGIKAGNIHELTPKYRIDNIIKMMSSLLYLIYEAVKKLPIEKSKKKYFLKIHVEFVSETTALMRSAEI
jgi:hypothetical protein